MNSLELKIPPPVVALLVGFLMWLSSRFLEPLGWPFLWRLAALLGLVAVGQGISIGGMVAFRRARTTINPLKPGAASSLVRGGVYRFTRNPMYLGLLITLLGWALFLARPAVLLWLPLFALYIQRFQIRPEERVLARLFGAEYEAFCASVRRWL